jgi:hypothetical protein
VFFDEMSQGNQEPTLARQMGQLTGPSPEHHFSIAERKTLKAK